LENSIIDQETNSATERKALNFMSNMRSTFIWKEFFGNHPDSEAIILGDLERSAIVSGRRERGPRAFSIEMNAVLFLVKVLNWVLWVTPSLEPVPLFTASSLV